jgi:hypothetical protein
MQQAAGAGMTCCSTLFFSQHGHREHHKVLVEHLEARAELRVGHTQLTYIGSEATRLMFDGQLQPPVIEVAPVTLLMCCV